MQRSLVRCGILLQVTAFNNAYAWISAIRSLKSDLASEGEGKKKRKTKNLMTKGAKLSIFEKKVVRNFTLYKALSKCTREIRGGLFDRKKKHTLRST
jgi:hypothetical protein